MTSTSQLTIGTKVTNGTYVGKVRKILDSRTVTVAWGPMMDVPDAATTVEFAANLTRCERGQLLDTPDMFDVVAAEIADAMNSRRPVVDYDDEGPFIRLSGTPGPADDTDGAR